MKFIAEKERLANKEVMPTEEIINHFLGEKNVCRLRSFEEMLCKNYELNRELNSIWEKLRLGLPLHA